MSHTILIVEDEQEKAKGIAFIINRYCPGFSPEFFANNGKEGLNLALRCHPDIVMTDIRMPEMDGLEMIRHLKEQGSTSIFIVLSGYAEFEYAKRAIELGVKNFITKPVDERELVKTLTAAREELADKKEREEHIARMSDDIHAFEFREFLSGREDIAARIGEFFETEGILDSRRQFFSMIIECASAENSFPEGKRTQGDTFFYTIRIGRTKYAVMTASPKLDTAVKKKIANEIVNSCKDPKTVSCGVGRTVLHYKEIPDSFQEAQVALNYRILQENQPMLFYEELNNMEENTELITDEEIARLEESIGQFDRDQFKLLIRQIFRRVLAEKTLSLPELKKLSLDIVLIGLKSVPTAQLIINNYFDRNLFTLESIEKFQTIEQLENWIVNMINSMNELMLHEGLPKKQDIIAEAKAYICKHYNQNITLNDIAGNFYINPSYFSQLFKRKTGETYQKFLTDYRLDRARKLLEETDLPVYEVCQLVGYSDVNHFNQIFERNVGIKPRQYREQMIKND